MSASGADYETIIFSVENFVARITLNRPQAMNARNLKMRAELMDAYARVQEEQDIRVLIITGAGDRAFCTGRDLKEASNSIRPPIELRQQMRALSDSERLAQLDKPTIAAINGFALGGGLEMALGCDFRIASATAQFGLTEVRRGMIPGTGGTQRLPRLIGVSRALRLMMTGEVIDANEALRIGIVDQVAAPAELSATAQKLADAIAAQAPLAVRCVKEAVYAGMNMPLSQGLRLEQDLFSFLEGTEDRREGVKAFVEKRAPVWSGR